MRLAFFLPLLFAAGLLLAAPVRADYDSSQAWFQALSADERADAQSDLILLGDYPYLVDGQFGTGTYNALTEFQNRQGSPQTGVLSAGDRRALDELARKVEADFGIQRIQDDEAKVSIAIPTGLLTTSYKTGHGTKWSTPDGGMTVETILGSDDASFAEIYDQLNRDGKGRIVTSSSYSDSLFLVRGHQDGRDFYTMYKNTPNGRVGYQLTWSLAYAEKGNVLSIYIASNFNPLASLPPDGGLAKTAGNTATQHFGVWVLPADMPSVIALDGEVGDDFYDDFERALEARPDATVMLLNSPGGLVTAALAVAREVRDRGMSTLVQSGAGCYSACAYIFFAGQPREADGELGVHQISAEVADNVLTQTTLGDIIELLNSFDVKQQVIVQMLHTPPDDIYVFSGSELTDLEVNRGGPVQIASVEVPTPTPAPNPSPAPQSGPVAFVHLAQHSTESEAQRTLKYAEDHWASVLGGAIPEVEREDAGTGVLYQVRVPARSMENATAICAAIHSAGGGCYVTGD